MFIPKRRASVELFPTYLRLIPAHISFPLGAVAGGGGILFSCIMVMRRRCEDRAACSFKKKPAERKKMGGREWVAAAANIGKSAYTLHTNTYSDVRFCGARGFRTLGSQLRPKETRT